MLRWPKRFDWLLLVFLAACNSNDAPKPENETTDQVVQDLLVSSEPTEIAEAATIQDISPRRPVIDETIAYGEANKANIHGYLAMPADALEPQPGVVLVHEWWGLNDNIKAMARRIAGEGYVVLATDLYAGEVADSTNAAQVLMATVLNDPEATVDNIAQASNYLRGVLAPKVAILGWGLGGTWSLESTLTLEGQIDAMIMYYGQVDLDAERLSSIDIPIMGFFGADDSSISVRDVQKFRVELTELGTDSEIRIYSNAAHAFANPDGKNYAGEAAEDAWDRTVAFLQRTLKD